MVRSVGPHLLRLYPNATINDFEKMFRKRLKVTHDLGLVRVADIVKMLFGMLVKGIADTGCSGTRYH